MKRLIVAICGLWMACTSSRHHDIDRSLYEVPGQHEYLNRKALKYPEFNVSCYHGVSDFKQNGIIGEIFYEDSACKEDTNIGKPCQLHENDILKAEEILDESSDFVDTNRRCKFEHIDRKVYHTLISSDYLRQYFGRVVNNDTLIFINLAHSAMIKDLPNWKTKEIVVFGGGGLFWNTIVDLTLGRIVHFWVNAPE